MTVLKYDVLLMFQIERFVIFLDYVDVGMFVIPMKVIKYYRKPYGNCQLKLSTQVRICMTVNKGWEKDF